jgi:hypothetical protein
MVDVFCIHVWKSKVETALRRGERRKMIKGKSNWDIL